MPVIVIGADTAVGAEIVATLRPKSGEIRVFISDPDAADRYRGIAKVAIGDLSDGTHVGGAAIGAFCAVAILAAAGDNRERHFAATPAAVLLQWADGLQDAGLSRVIAVGTAAELPQPNPLASAAAQYGFVDTAGKHLSAIAEEVAALEAANLL